MSSIAIIGSGSVGRALGAGLAGHGHAVVFGVRDPLDPRHHDLVRVAAVADAARDADAVVLAVPAGTLPEVIGELGLHAPQVVIDATNAVRVPVPEGFPTVADLVAARVPAGVAVVKAFNTIGAEHLGHGQVAGQAAFLPIAGDAAGVDLAQALATDLGFAPVPLGGRECFAMVEDHARLWIHLAFVTGRGRNFGFALLDG